MTHYSLSRPIPAEWSRVGVKAPVGASLGDYEQELVHFLAQRFDQATFVVSRDAVEDELILAAEHVTDMPVMLAHMLTSPVVPAGLR